MFILIAVQLLKQSAPGWIRKYVAYSANDNTHVFPNLIGGGRYVRSTMQTFMADCLCRKVSSCRRSTDATGKSRMAVKRAARLCSSQSIGQTKPVHVYQLIAEDTVESKVIDIQDKKKRLVEQVR